MQTVFRQICGTDFALLLLLHHLPHPRWWWYYDKEPGRSQRSHKVVVCLCNMGVRRPGIQVCNNKATQQPADFLSPGRPSRSSAPCRCWKCSFCSRLLFHRPPPLPPSSLFGFDTPALNENEVARLCLWASGVICFCGWIPVQTNRQLHTSLAR